jgi:low temperature requirement protein LtrA
LHHAVAAQHLAVGLIGFVTSFFAIWWAWMNFTWFASAYDTDDVPYRLKVLLQISGVLVFAAGIPRGFEQHDFSIMTLGYAIMRVALVAHWLRAAHADPPRRSTARRYALGITVCELGWIALLFLPPHYTLPGWALLAPLEMAVPVWAERKVPTLWHAHHIAERYGLMTLIVLGESVLAATLAIQSALDSGHVTLPIGAMIVGGLALLFSMWWMYFDDPAAAPTHSGLSSFLWGYGHYVLFMATAAVGAGFSACADVLTGHSALSHWQAGMTVAVPASVYVLLVWTLHIRPAACGAWLTAAFLTTPVVLLLAASSEYAVFFMGLAAATLVGLSVLRRGQLSAAH